MAGHDGRTAVEFVELWDVSGQLIEMQPLMVRSAPFGARLEP